MTLFKLRIIIFCIIVRHKLNVIVYLLIESDIFFAIASTFFNNDSFVSVNFDLIKNAKASRNQKQTWIYPDAVLSSEQIERILYN